MIYNQKLTLQALATLTLLYTALEHKAQAGNPLK